MPQLMPLYWIISTVIIVFLLLMVFKIYGNYTLYLWVNNKYMNIKNLEKWYW